MIRKVISGGQTGADQAGLFAANTMGLKTGGWAPHGWQTKAGPNNWLMYLGLSEHEGGYKERTRSNVKDSDGTIRLAYSFQTPGEKCTLRAIKDYKRPYFDVDLNSYNLNEITNQFSKWINENKIKILNVAGNTEGTLGKNVFNTVFVIMCQFLFKDWTGVGALPLTTDWGEPM